MLFIFLSYCTHHIPLFRSRGKKNKRGENNIQQQYQSYNTHSKTELTISYMLIDRGPCVHSLPGCAKGGVGGQRDPDCDREPTGFGAETGLG